MKGADTGRNGARRTRRWLIAALLAATAFIAAPSLASADGGSGTATLSTDQLSYSPGGVVDLSGAGFVAGDSITVTLADSLSGSTYATANVTAGSDGSFTDVDLTLPPDFMSSLAATATDSATGDSASTPVTETLAPPSFTPTITTDQQDYAPGSVVTITGSGWPAGDAVSVFTDDSDNNSWSQTDQVTTDASGDFTDRVTLPLMFIANYTVTASDANGLSATTSFTDGNVTAATVDVRKSDCVTQQTIFNIGDTLCAHSTITTVTGNGAGQLFVQWVNPSGANVGSAVQHNGNAGDSFNDSLALTSTSPTGTWKVEVCSNSSCNSNQVLNSENFTVGLGTTTTVTSSGTPSTYGSPVTFTASVSASTNPGAHGTVTFKDGTTAICTNVALNSSSQATCSTSTLSATDSPHSITAVYSGATSGSTTWNGSTS
jgi:hypothetical protein